ncbi:hypothetical protein CBR_g38248 [Chara braunii]|uniref:Uncharacterized protein n=1 Tax=Chara braunii TaxID=69332 RepID=A0A388LPM3_CHABU|nr:hypothetical protein CBR_g38248 [Chara braunii]|eukprot:GBG84277.1 hypothetical protein CBR_g38248 [Chara braunii]
MKRLASARQACGTSESLSGASGSFGRKASSSPGSVSGAVAGSSPIKLGSISRSFPGSASASSGRHHRRSQPARHRQLNLQNQQQQQQLQQQQKQQQQLPLTGPGRHSLSSSSSAMASGGCVLPATRATAMEDSKLLDHGRSSAAAAAVGRPFVVGNHSAPVDKWASRRKASFTGIADIPETWHGERHLRSIVDWSDLDSALGPHGLLSARDALIREQRSPQPFSQRWSNLMQ